MASTLRTRCSRWFCSQELVDLMLGLEQAGLLALARWRALVIPLLVHWSSHLAVFCCRRCPCPRPRFVVSSTEY